MVPPPSQTETTTDPDKKIIFFPFSSVAKNIIFQANRMNRLYPFLILERPPCGPYDYGPFLFLPEGHYSRNPAHQCMACFNTPFPLPPQKNSTRLHDYYSRLSRAIKLFSVPFSRTSLPSCRSAAPRNFSPTTAPAIF